MLESTEKAIWERKYDDRGVAPGIKRRSKAPAVSDEIILSAVERRTSGALTMIATTMTSAMADGATE